MDTTIFMGYEPFTKRLLESEVVFEFADGKVRTDAGLAKRAKAQRSTTDWHHTRKVLLPRLRTGPRVYSSEARIL